MNCHLNIDLSQMPGQTVLYILVAAAVNDPGNVQIYEDYIIPTDANEFETRPKFDGQKILNRIRSLQFSFTVSL